MEDNLSLDSTFDTQASQNSKGSLENKPEHDILAIKASYLPIDDESFGFTVAENEDDIRRKYLNKLSNMKLLPQKTARKYQTPIVFDWDDTLFCATFLQKNELKLEGNSLSLVKLLDESAAKLLATASNYGEVFIVTNSDVGWVELTAKTFMQNTHTMIVSKEIKIIYAKSLYENEAPRNPYYWKTEAFLSLKKMYNTDILTNIICVGDSEAEIEAATILALDFPKAFLKTIKLKERPSIKELLKQQKFVLDEFERIYLELEHIKINIKSKSNEKKKSTRESAKNKKFLL